ncbi:hypothetical protein NCCP2222_24640 [Sporosarcina sp. NCCP-2222]|nr:hypothetical protein NCCP2222_24640 [Sporosarcina sp. NCCP-2222]
MHNESATSGRLLHPLRSMNDHHRLVAERIDGMKKQNLLAENMTYTIGRSHYEKKACFLFGNIDSFIRGVYRNEGRREKYEQCGRKRDGCPDGCCDV